MDDDASVSMPNLLNLVRVRCGDEGTEVDHRVPLSGGGPPRQTARRSASPAIP